MRGQWRKRTWVSCREITRTCTGGAAAGAPERRGGQGGAAPRHVCHRVCGGVGAEGGAGEEAVAVRDHGLQTHIHA